MGLIEDLRLHVVMLLFAPLQQEAVESKLAAAIPSAEAGFSRLSISQRQLDHIRIFYCPVLLQLPTITRIFCFFGQPSEDTRDAPIAVLRPCQEPPAKQASNSPTPQAIARPLRRE